MSDRLKDLLHQRALVQEQLVWLDREIAAARATAPVSGVIPIAIDPLPITGAALPAARSPSEQAAVDATAEEILAQYKNEGPALESNVKRGCFLYFFIALALLGLAVFALYFFRTKR